MSSEKLEMCNTLIKWFHKLDIDAPHETASDLSDGVAMAKALKQIAPDVFTGILQFRTFVLIILY